MRPLAALTLLALGCACSPSGPTTRPNFVVILADDQGWGDLSASGNTNLSTPNIDSLARDGATIERFFVSTVCSPTRAELLTGRYFPRTGVYGTSAGAERLNLDERTFAEAFRAAGYATGAFGKWHNGGQGPYHPNARGFEEFYGFTSGHWAHYFSPPLDHNGRLVRGDGFVIDDFTNRAIEYVRQNRERPFFVYLPYNTPHSPMQVPDEFWERFKDRDLAMRARDGDGEDLDHTRAALAMVENIDWNVGRMLAALDELGLAENTVVVYFSDNGPNGWRWNGGMKGRKGSIDEGGVRSPFFIRWPARIPAGKRVDEIAAAIDLGPTFAEMACIALPEDKPLDGRSVAPLLTGETADWPDRTLFSFAVRGDGVSARNRRFRLDAAGRLFDLEADPGQRTDVAAEHPEVAARLRAEAAAIRGEALAGFGEDGRPYPVGYGETTWLPARDAVASGGVERSNRFPNSSYFLNWTQPEGALNWDIEVLTEGEYEAVAYYACPEQDLGARVELSFRDARTMTKIRDAHDPPLVGADEDRVPRGESYTKDFRPVSLGALRLEAGRGDLRLTAPDIPGSQAWEVAGLMLIRR